nr:putative reverse transcriptase domain-containing protein [Tanacetum cinerariifolium]
MAPKRTSTFAAPAMTHAAIRQLIADSIVAALEAQAATMANTNHTNKNTRPSETLVARKGTNDPKRKFIDRRNTTNNDNNNYHNNRDNNNYPNDRNNNNHCNNRNNNKYQDNRNNNNRNNDYHQHQNRRQETIKTHAATPTKNERALQKSVLKTDNNTFHVSNLKKCISDKSLVIPMKEIWLNDKLNFVEEPVEIIDREVKQLRQSCILIVKVRWDYEFTWELEDQIRAKYPLLFSDITEKSN